jgi:hypothetical protein
LPRNRNLTAANTQRLTAAQLTAPPFAIDANEIKGATAKSTLSTLNDFLRAEMELLKDTHAEAYQALREASQVDDARRGKEAGKSAQPRVAATGDGRSSDG